MTPPGMNVVSRPVVLPSPIAFGRWASVAPFAAPWSGAAWGLSSYAPVRVELADAATQTPWWIAGSGVAPVQAEMQAGGQGAELYMTAGTHGVVDAVAGGMFAAGVTSRPGRTVVEEPGTLGGGGGGDDDLLSKPIKGHVADCLRIAGIGVADEGYIEFLEQYAAEWLTVGEVVDLLRKADQIFQKFAYHVPLKMQIVGRIVTGKYAEGAIGELNQILAGWNIGTDGHPIIVENPDGSTVKGVNMSPAEINYVADSIVRGGVGNQSIAALMGHLAEHNPELAMSEALGALRPFAEALGERHEAARLIALADYFGGRYSAEDLAGFAAALQSGHFWIVYNENFTGFEVRDRWLEWAENIDSNGHMFSRKWIAAANAYAELDFAAHVGITDPPAFAIAMDNFRPAVFAGSRNHLGTMIHEANMPVDGDEFYRVAGMRAYLIVGIEEMGQITEFLLRPNGGSVPREVAFNAPALSVQVEGRPPLVKGDRVFIIPGTVGN